ncbi:MAG TPA: acyl-ACP--UDP-N-acetylglucosamine O-acyltransferase [Candidatus Baltobacteraceae bacterium]|nr:acyl-ACP--UDP-N-acetylglucosamine O-acyltransferase [Candidatus Baltobacteraceae bacterium]
MISPTAIVHPDAKVGRDAEIGPYCVVGEHVKIGERTKLLAHVVVTGRTTIGTDVEIHPFASIGAPSQDRKAREDEQVFTTIGDRTVIREYVSIHRPSADAGPLTSIGTDCLLLAYVHVAHNCRVGNNVTMSNMAQIAGHVVVEDSASIGAMAGVHQFARIGAHAFLGGYSKLTRDLPPYFLAEGNPIEVHGLNSVGLRRAGFARETLAELKAAFKTLYRSGLNLSQAVAELRPTLHTTEGRALLAFLEAPSERGILK